MAEGTTSGGKELPADMGKEELAERALEDERFRSRLVAALSGPGRSERARAAEAVHELACKSAEVLRPHVPELTDALDRPEVQTRWEVLGALEEFVAVDARVIDKAIPAITVSLHDAESGVVRIAAFRLLARYGSTTAKRSERVWPLLDEAVRAYHGDPEFPAMLGAVVTLVEGAATDEVREAAAEFFEPETTHPKALISRRAKRIVSRSPREPGEGSEKEEG